MWRKIGLYGAAGLAVVALGIQLVPYGRDHTNPPVSGEPDWDSPRARELAQRACFDCHSNETVWPWYSHVAPLSWIVARHVDEGRGELNFSEWDREQRHADEAAEAVGEGWMPLPGYLRLHPEARLTEAERAELAAAFTSMFGGGEHAHAADPAHADPHAAHADPHAAHADPHAAHGAHAAPGAGPLRLELDGGAPWPLDDATRAALADLRVILAQGPPADAPAMAAAIDTRVLTLLTECTMTGPAHDQLHRWLTAFGPAVERLEDAPQPEGVEQAHAALVALVDEAERAFE